MPQNRPSDWLILTGLALGMCVTNGFARFAYGLILPAMRSELGWTYAQAGWLNTANAMGYIAGAVGTMILIRRIAPTTLFSFGFVTTAVCLLATGLYEPMWWQSLWRFLTGLCGALSFASAGALTSQLFKGDPRRNALAIAILFGSGGGLGIVLSGAGIPPLLDRFGPGAWPWAWIGIGTFSLASIPLALWSARHLRADRQGLENTRLPVRRMLPELVGYGCFGAGYIVYLTFLSAWMTAQLAATWLISLVWVLLGLCMALSPFLWRGLFARFASGLPLALILLGIATGSALPVFLPSTPGMILSALVFGLCVFMAPGAITNFSRQNLPPDSWGAAISLFTVIFAVSQTLGPVGAGALGDMAGSIGAGLLAASGILLVGAAAAILQRPLSQ